MTPLIINDLLRTFKRARTWLFIALLAVAFIIHYYTVATGLGFEDSYFEALPVTLGLTEFPNGLLFLLVFGMPATCGDFSANDKATELQAMFIVRGSSMLKISASRIVSSLITSLLCCLLIFIPTFIFSSSFFSGEVLSTTTLGELIDYQIQYLPSIAHTSIWLWWALIAMIYILYCWGTLCLSQLLGTLTGSKAFSIFFPISLTLLLADLFFNNETGNTFCYLDLSFTSRRAMTLYEAHMQSIQLPLFITLLIALNLGIGIVDTYLKRRKTRELSRNN